MEWEQLQKAEQLTKIQSADGYHLIFKHSSRCSISLMAKRKFDLESALIPSEVNFYFLDILNYRDLSNAVATIFEVHHESPQILLIKDGECLLEASHGAISALEVAEQFTTR